MGNQGKGFFAVTDKICYTDLHLLVDLFSIKQFNLNVEVRKLLSSTFWVGDSYKLH